MEIVRIKKKMAGPTEKEAKKKTRKRATEQEGLPVMLLFFSAEAESPVDPSKEYDQHVTIPYRHPPVSSACLPS